MSRGIILETIEGWPNFAKKGDYSPWETQGRTRAEARTQEIWDEYAPEVYQSVPTGERRDQGRDRILDSLIWRLNKLKLWISGKKDEKSLRTPDDVIDKIKTNGPFPNVKLRGEHKPVDLFFDLTLAKSVSDGDAKGVGVFVDKYGEEIVRFAKKSAKTYVQTVDKSDRDALYAQFNLDSLNDRDSDNFRRWVRYFLDCAGSAFKYYRGRAPLCCRLRVEIFRLLHDQFFSQNSENAREGKIRRITDRDDEGNKIEDRIVDNLNLDPSDSLIWKLDREAIKDALWVLQGKNEELYDVILLRFYEDFTYLEIADEMNYTGSDDTKEHRAQRNVKAALKKLKKILEKLQK